MAERITSYDVPEWIKDRINSAANVEEIVAFRNSVKSPAEIGSTVADRQVWWACQAAIDAEMRQQQEPDDDEDGIDFMEIPDLEMDAE